MKTPTKKRIVVSASMAILAVNAMGELAQRPGPALGVPQAQATSEVAKKIDAALEKPSVRHAVSSSFALLAAKFGDADATIAEKYFPGEGSLLLAAADIEMDDDFTDGNPGCYSAPTLTGCYANCHSACHTQCYSNCHTPIVSNPGPDKPVKPVKPVKPTKPRNK